MAHMEYSPFEQQEKLTTRLQNILREYPQGLGPFYEALQNAGKLIDAFGLL